MFTSFLAASRLFFKKGKIMKPYFAKYLPVEGEIKEGDRVKLPTEFIATAVIENGKIGWHALNNNTIGHVYFLVGSKKVKLFLCSRDIQIGDKVLCPMPYQNNKLEEFIITEKPKNYHLDMLVGRFADGREMKEPAYLNQSTFKIIGEISPDALSYIKEGDEIDENHVEAWYYDDLHKSFLLKVGRLSVLQVDEEKWRELRGVRTIFKIKGQCGHFH